MPIRMPRHMSRHVSRHASIHMPILMSIHMSKHMSMHTAASAPLDIGCFSSACRMMTSSVGSGMSPSGRFATLCVRTCVEECIDMRVDA